MRLSNLQRLNSVHWVGIWKESVVVYFTSGIHVEKLKESTEISGGLRILVLQIWNRKSNLHILQVFVTIKR
jgi:hypothetical protein